MHFPLSGHNYTVLTTTFYRVKSRCLFNDLLLDLEIICKVNYAILSTTLGRFDFIQS